MIIDPRQIDEAKTRFTELGRVIADLSKTSEEAFESTLAALKEYSDNSQLALSDFNVSSLKGLSFALQKQHELVVSALSEFPSKSSGVLDSFNRTLEAANDKFSDVTKFSDSVKQSYLSSLGKAQTRRRGSGYDAGGKKGERGEGEEGRKQKTLTEREYLSLAQLGTQGAKKLQLPTKGEVGATIVGWMVSGLFREQRIAAEAAEVFNIYQSAFGSFSKEVIQKGTSMISTWQEKLQQSFGIGRDQIQGVAKAFTDGGLSIEEQQKRTGMSFKDLGDSMTLFTLGVDKMFELAGGQTAERMVGLMRNYGESTNQAAASTLRLMMAGKESGIGTMQFEKNVQTAAEAVKNYGFNIDDVISTAIGLQKHFEAMGVPKQYAGRLAAEGLREAAGLVGNMSDQWKMIIGEKMGFGKGLDAVQGIYDKMKELAKSDNKEYWFKYLKSIYAVVMEMANGDKNLAQHILRSGLNVKQPGVEAIMNIGSIASYGAEADKAVAANLGTLKDSFSDESKKTQEWQLKMNEWMQGIAKIGGGMLDYVSQLLVYMITVGKSLTGILQAKLTGDDARMKQIMESIDKKSAKLDESKDKIMTGLRETLAASGGMFEIIFGEDLAGEAKKAAKKVLPKSLQGSAQPVLPEIPFLGGEFGVGERQRLAPSVPSGSQVRVVTVPVSTSSGGEGSGGASPQGAAEPSEDVGGQEGGFDDQEGDFSGGSLSIVSKGVDQQGNIQVALVGNCPSCGLVFGGEPVQESGSAVHQPDAITQATPTPGYIYPLAEKPSAAYSKDSKGSAGTRYFGAKRKSGKFHPGVDLIAKEGTPVYAMAGGKVKYVTPFTHGVREDTGEKFQTYAVSIDDGTRTLLYGEISTDLKPGMQVKQGQQIGKVMRQKKHSMLHLEAYSNKVKGNPLVGSVSSRSEFPRRRSDIIDPTPLIGV